MVIILSIEESAEEIISGFPERITLSTNIPSTIFYTLDGTEPDENSLMFVDEINLPTNGKLVILKAIAISGNISSAILEKVYFTNQNNITKTRLIDKEGISTLPFGEAAIDSIAFDYNGEAAKSTVIPFQDLEIKASTTNNIGEDIPGDTTLDFINFSIKSLSNEPSLISSPNDNNINFNPKAQYIIIDSSSESLANNQSIKVINRPNNSLDLNSKFYTESTSDRSLNSANFVRYMIDPKTGKTTFYYRDSRENRWLRSTQKIERRTLNLTPKGGPPNSFVFRWVEFRSQSKLY